MECLRCGRSIDSRRAWKSCNGRFYCSEFCADSEDEFCSTSPEPHPVREVSNEAAAISSLDRPRIDFRRASLSGGGAL